MTSDARLAGRPGRRTDVRRRRLGALLALAAVTACDHGLAPNQPFALEFRRLPWPSVVYGDTLRDSTGARAALRAIVLDASGDTLADPGTAFVSLDTGVTIAGTTLVGTGWTTTGVRLVAVVGGLQSRPLTLQVTRRPDTLAAGTPPAITYDVLPTDPRNTSGAVTVRLRSRQGTPATSDSAVRGWVVQFAITRRPPATLMDSVLLVGKSSAAPTDRDTTDASGQAAVRVRVVPKPGQTAADSVVLQATASYKGLPVPGSPVRIVVRLTRATGG